MFLDGHDKTYGLRKNSAEPTELQKRFEAVRERNNSVEPMELQKRPEVVRERKPEPKKSTTMQSVESMKQWQIHHRKMFPTFKFYFENLPVEDAGRLSRQARLLGAVSFPD